MIRIATLLVLVTSFRTFGIGMSVERVTPDKPWIDPYRVLVVRTVDINESDVRYIGTNGRTFTSVGMRYLGFGDHCSYAPEGDSRPTCVARPPGLVLGCSTPAQAVTAIRSLVGARFQLRLPEPPPTIEIVLSCSRGGPFYQTSSIAVDVPGTTVSCYTDDVSLELSGEVGSPDIRGVQLATIRCTGDATVKLTLTGGGVIEMGPVRAKVRVNGGTAVSLQVPGEARANVSATLTSVPDRAGVFSGSTVMTTDIE